MKIIIPILLILVSFYARAQHNVPDLVTDRPDQTESSVVVPFRFLQIETGFLLENDKENNMRYQSYAYNSTLLRYGLMRNMELRLGLEYLADRMKATSADYTNTASGFGPLYTGFKIKIADEQAWKPEIAFLGAVILPFTANDSYKPAHSATSMLFAFSHTLSDRLSLGYNLGTSWDGETAIPDYFYSVSLGIGLTEKLGAYIESYGAFPEEGKPEHLADAGFTYLVSPNFQLDLSGGIGLYNATDNFISCGFTYRIPD